MCKPDMNVPVTKKNKKTIDQYKNNIQNEVLCVRSLKIHKQRALISNKFSLK